MKVRIDGAGHEVEIECDHTDLGYVVDKAKTLWEDTRQPEAPLGPATGFQIVERADPR